MQIAQAQTADAAAIASVLQEAAAWLDDTGRALWSEQDVSDARVLQDTRASRYFVARDNSGEIVGVNRFDLEDLYFWPEIEPGTSAFVHKLAVRRSWAGKGVPVALLGFAKARAAGLGLPWLRLDCVADRAALRALYEGLGFRLHSCIDKVERSFARYELPTGG